MKPVSQFVFTAVVAGLTAAGVASLLAPHADEATRAEAAGTAAAVSSLQASVAAVQSAQRDLRTSIDSLGLQLSAAGGRAQAQPLEELEATVLRLLEQHQSASLAAGAAPAGANAGSATADGELDLDDAVASLLDPRLGDAEREALWQAVTEAGLLDDVLAVYEARVKANPNDPKLQVELGQAYLQKIFEVGSGPQAGLWASKADSAFDAALALDDHNWEARFTKAVSLSFWPPIFGKQPEAISHLQTLLGQQAQQPKSAQFAQTYLMLGNLYAQQGQSGQAEAMWKQGLAEYPDDAQLKGKFATP